MDPLIKRPTSEQTPDQRYVRNNSNYGPRSSVAECIEHRERETHGKLLQRRVGVERWALARTMDANATLNDLIRRLRAEADVAAAKQPPDTNEQDRINKTIAAITNHKHAVITKAEGQRVSQVHGFCSSIAR